MGVSFHESRTPLIAKKVCWVKNVRLDARRSFQVPLAKADWILDDKLISKYCLLVGKDHMDGPRPHSSSVLSAGFDIGAESCEDARRNFWTPVAILRRDVPHGRGTAHHRVRIARRFQSFPGGSHWWGGATRGGICLAEYILFHREPPPCRSRRSEPSDKSRILANAAWGSAAKVRRLCCCSPARPPCLT